jgi:hypothetical protein
VDYTGGFSFAVFPGNYSFEILEFVAKDIGVMRAH